MKKILPVILSAALLLCACAVPSNIPDVPNDPSLPVQGNEEIPDIPTEPDEPELPRPFLACGGGAGEKLFPKDGEKVLTLVEK